MKIYNHHSINIRYSITLTILLLVLGIIAGCDTLTSNGTESKFDITAPNIVAANYNGMEIEIISLGNLGGKPIGEDAPPSSMVSGINDDGQVVGGSFSTDNGREHAFIWENGTMTDLGTLGVEIPYPAGANVPSSAATYINNNGVIAGNSSGKNDKGETYGPVRRAVVWENREIRLLKSNLENPEDQFPGIPITTAKAINNNGVVVGSIDFQAALWKDDEITLLGSLYNTYYSGAAADINDKMQIVGTTKYSPNCDHGFLWENGVMKDLGTLEGHNSTATAINESGQIVGSDAGGAILWDNGKKIRLEDLGGDFTRANSINEKGQIVGFGTLPGPVFKFHALLWQPDGELIDLHEIAKESGLDWRDSRALSINNKGEIAGNIEKLADNPGDYYDSNIVTEATVWRIDIDEQK